MPRKPAARYGIAEWYGHDITTLTDAQRRSLGDIALKQAQNEAPESVPACRFLSDMGTPSPCNKSGGLCSMRPYDQGESLEREITIQKKGQSSVIAIHAGLPQLATQPSTMCPLRFLEDREIFRWVGEIMLEVTNPLVVKETPFLKRLAGADDVIKPSGGDDTEEEDKKRAGRIDWLLVDPASVDSGELKWCALETQGVYFSGTKMENEFSVYAQDGEHLLYPVGNRRPDYRSNGPKRLAPQLSVKVPVLRSWGTKVAVVVDRYFLGEMAKLESPFRTARTEKDKRDRAEVVWFVVEYDAQMKLKRHQVFYSDLDSSVKALNATEPIELSTFKEDLKALLKDPKRRGSKVYDLPITDA